MLYIVPTPIGNLGDITYRAVEVLRNADLILAEDTRQTIRLLQHLNISKKIRSFHQHNEHHTLSSICDELDSGTKMALVSDAGTPGISDPGFLLARACAQRNIPFECLPGPVAFIPALIESALPCDRFVFEGFLPHKKGRMTRLNLLKEEERTIVFYESPHRVLKTLEQLSEFFGSERPASISRELTKIYHETIRDTIGNLCEHFKQKEPKGEFVIIVAGKP